jgi:hypothetical protein
MAAMPHMPPVNLIRQLLMFNPGVPRRLRFWLIVMFAIFYQFAGGVYLASLSQMMGELAFLSEDLTMASYCSLIGLNIIFPMLFRWKFGLYTRQLCFVSSVAVILCTVAATYITIPWMLWIVCFFAGYFKMMGMFGCMSTIQLNITPTRNFAVFFPVIYVIVCGTIQLSGLATSYITYFSNWRMVNMIVVVMMLIIDVIVYFLMRRDHRSGPVVPLKGIDWIGQILWTLVCVAFTWIFTFGEHYDWWESIEVWRATFIFIILLATVLIYSRYKKEPYIDLKAFCYPQPWRLILLLAGMSVLHGSAHVLQPVYLSGVMHYDSLNVISLNYPELAGIVMGAILAYFILVRWRWNIKQYLFVTFLMATYYVMSMYFICDTATDKETMYLALFALGVSEVMIETIATFYLSQTIPFKHFFMNITIIGFWRCGPGTAAGGALVHRFFNWATAKNMMIATENITPGSLFSGNMPDFEVQGLLMAIKESYGLMITVGILMMLIIMISNYHTSIKRFVPRIMAVRSWITNKQASDPTI